MDLTTTSPERIAEDWETAIVMFPSARLACVSCGNICSCVGVDGWDEGPVCADIDACRVRHDAINESMKG